MTDPWDPPPYSERPPIRQQAPPIPLRPAARRRRPFGSYGDREPVRFPVWALTLLGAATSLGIDLLSDVDWRTALIGFLTGLMPLYGVELARQRAWTPLSVLKATEDARTDEAERASRGVPGS